MEILLAHCLQLNDEDNVPQISNAGASTIWNINQAGSQRPSVTVNCGEIDPQSNVGIQPGEKMRARRYPSDLPSSGAKRGRLTPDSAAGHGETRDLNAQEENADIFAGDANTSFVSYDGHKQRRYVYDYLTDVDMQWVPAQHWNVNDFDITKLLMDFRQRSIRLAKKGNLRDIRVLSLSNIFFMSPTWSDSCFHRFSEKYHAAVKAHFSCKSGWRSLPLQARVWCAELDACMSLEDELPLDDMREKCHAFSKAIRKTAKSDDVCVMSVLLTRVIETFDDWTVESRLNESSFVNQHLSPIIKTVFSRHFGLDSRHGETRIKHTDSLAKADYVVYHPAPDQNIYDLITFEVKPPEKSSEAQTESDFVKVGKEMKTALDCLIDLGLENPVVGGVLVKGYEATTFKLQLEAEGVYFMNTLANVHLLRSPMDVTLLPQIVESLLQLRTCIQPTLLSIDDVLTRDSTTGSQIPKKAWKRPSSAAPLRTDERR
ncbi:hypothetical protein BCR43DRAFT_500114 [Syncephalastrum racemosum]|uniref:Uncharacterized protein n=1 Tax=Syncephalastrum racemosum TaxID=13706 RepID=A0A1X2GZ07_SYNRA|nr:hypothetical protein BCR43DRAFT_500114 [Syncephalastrum racemosum]